MQPHGKVARGGEGNRREVIFPRVGARQRRVRDRRAPPPPRRYGSGGGNRQGSAAGGDLPDLPAGTRGHRSHSPGTG